jgi:hypothetical protein
MDTARRVIQMGTEGQLNVSGARRSERPSDHRVRQLSLSEIPGNRLFQA